MGTGKALEEEKLKIEIDLFDAVVLNAIASCARKNLVEIINHYENNRFQDPFLKDPFWPSLNLLRNPINETILDRASLVLVPLDRVGVSNGASGSKVIICYFKIDNVDLKGIEEAKHQLVSLPMVVKYRINDKDSGSLENKLEVEYNNSKDIQVFADHSNGCFALPLKYDKTYPEISVLWSSFKSNQFFTVNDNNSTLSGNEYILSEQNLSKILRSCYDTNNLEEFKKVEPILDNVYSNLKPLHMRLGYFIREERELIKEYDWYLRGIFSEKWADIWKGIWGPDTQEEVMDFDRNWINPFWVLSKLKDHKVLMHIGSIHGDLHPRNIVISHDSSPHLIDFQWAQDMTHIVKDFVLMECNLRFVTLGPDISYKEISLLSEYIDHELKTDDFPENMSEYTKNVVNLIRFLRNKAKEHINDVDWTNEYVIPLFLVSIGLLRYGTSIDNQIASRLTVLNLAKFIKKEVIDNALSK